MTHPEQVHKFLSKDGYVRVSSVVCTGLIEHMRLTVNSLPLATVIGGRSLIASALMISHLKEGTVGLNFKGDGPIGTVYSEAQSDGAVRVYVSNPTLELALENNKLNIPAAVGKGILEVVRGTPFEKSKQTGKVEIQTGEVGDDVVFYLQQSFQIPSVMALSVETGEHGVVTGAGGVFVEVMPGYTKDVIDLLDKNVRRMPGLGHMIESGFGPADIVQPFLRDMDFAQLEPHKPLRYECRCTKEKVLSSLALLGHETLDDMISKDEETDVTCNFCGKAYNVSIDELKDVRAKSYQDSIH